MIMIMKMKIALKTVEQYDPFNDSWSKFPSMINTRCCHKSVTIKNKLFVIGGGTETCEVYDSVCKQFVVIKPISKIMKLLKNSINVNLLYFPAFALAVESKVFVFARHSSVVLCYDVDRNEWSDQSCEALENHLFCVKVPQL